MVENMLDILLELEERVKSIDTDDFIGLGIIKANILSMIYSQKDKINNNNVSGSQYNKHELNNIKTSIERLESDVHIQTEYSYLYAISKDVKSLRNILDTSSNIEIFQRLNELYKNDNKYVISESNQIYNRSVIRDMKILEISVIEDNQHYIDDINIRYKTSFTLQELSLIKLSIIHNLHKTFNEEAFNKTLLNQISQYKNLDSKICDILCSMRYIIDLIIYIGMAIFRVVKLRKSENEWPFRDNLEDSILSGFEDIPILDINSYRKIRLLNIKEYDGIDILRLALLNMLKQYIEELKQQK